MGVANAGVVTMAAIKIALQRRAKLVIIIFIAVFKYSVFCCKPFKHSSFFDLSK